jgi:hypothetical protein
MANDAPGDMVEIGPTEPSGLADEAECPADHWDLRACEACYVCKAIV